MRYSIKKFAVIFIILSGCLTPRPTRSEFDSKLSVYKSCLDGRIKALDDGKSDPDKIADSAIFACSTEAKEVIATVGRMEGKFPTAPWLRQQTSILQMFAMQRVLELRVAQK